MNQDMELDSDQANRPLNKALRLVGPDAGPDWTLEVEWDNGEIHPLMTIYSVDATAVGMTFSAAARCMGLPLHLVTGEH